MLLASILQHFYVFRHEESMTFHFPTDMKSKNRPFLDLFIGTFVLEYRVLSD